MAIVGMSGGNKKRKKRPAKQKAGSVKPVIRPDTTWYKPHCKKCPYLVKDEEKKMAFCIRPFGEPCLAEGILIQGVLAIEEFRVVTKQMDTLDKELTAKEVGRIHKKIKRRR